MNIDIIKGPLSNSQLSYIKNLYGQVDKKYSSIDFCKYLFNENPFGFSYHAFASDNDNIIGHIALIPVYVETPSDRYVSLKAEAFVIDSKYRDTWIEVNQEELPIGLALPKVIYNFADEQNYKLIHLLADSNIGKIHMFAGCNLFPVKYRDYFYILDKRVFVKKEGYHKKIFLITLASLWQSSMTFISLSFIKNTLSRNKYIDVINDHTPLLNKLPTHNHYQWSIAQTEAFLKWFYKSPYIKIYTYNKSLDDYFVVKESEYPGRCTEIIDIKLRKQSLRVYCRFLYYLLIKSRESQSSIITFKLFNHKPIPDKMKKALMIMGFLHKKSQLNCYLRTDVSYFHYQENLSYNQLFYIQY